MSRDPKLRQYIPNSWKEAMQTCGGSGCQERSPLGTVMGSLLKSLGTQSHSMSHVSLLAGPHRVFSLPGSPRQASATEDPPHTPLSLAKLQPQRITHTHTALPLAAPAPQNSLTAEPLPGMLSPLEARLCSPHKLEAA